MSKKIAIITSDLTQLAGCGIPTNEAARLAGSEQEIQKMDQARNVLVPSASGGPGWWVSPEAYEIKSDQIQAKPNPEPVRILATAIDSSPLFEIRASATIAKVTATFGQRGTEYGDTWRNGQWLNMRAVARKLNVEIPDKFLRALAAAALVDVKYQRQEGGYKEDNLIDGIAYQACLAAEMAELLGGGSGSESVGIAIK